MIRWTLTVVEWKPISALGDSTACPVTGLATGFILLARAYVCCAMSVGSVHMIAHGKQTNTPKKTP